jgi:hypothetical protein
MTFLVVTFVAIQACFFRPDTMLHLAHRRLSARADPQIGQLMTPHSPETGNASDRLLVHCGLLSPTESAQDIASIDKLGDGT